MQRIFHILQSTRMAGLDELRDCFSGGISRESNVLDFTNGTVKIASTNPSSLVKFAKYSAVIRTPIRVSR
jgi:hypothetical protein